MRPILLFLFVSLGPFSSAWGSCGCKLIRQARCFPAPAIHEMRCCGEREGYMRHDTPLESLRLKITPRDPNSAIQRSVTLENPEGTLGDYINLPDDELISNDWIVQAMGRLRPRPAWGDTISWDHSGNGPFTVSGSTMLYRDCNARREKGTVENIISSEPEDCSYVGQPVVVKHTPSAVGTTPPCDSCRNQPMCYGVIRCQMPEGPIDYHSACKATTVGYAARMSCPTAQKCAEDRDVIPSRPGAVAPE